MQVLTLCSSGPPEANDQQHARSKVYQIVYNVGDRYYVSHYTYAGKATHSTILARAPLDYSRRFELNHVNSRSFSVSRRLQAPDNLGTTTLIMYYRVMPQYTSPKSAPKLPR